MAIVAMSTETLAEALQAIVDIETASEPCSGFILSQFIAQKTLEGKNWVEELKQYGVFTPASNGNNVHDIFTGDRL
jgi:hypothetical protein